MSEWKEVKIGDVCSVKRGASPRPIQNFMCKNGMPWVKIADATRSNSRYINSTEEFIIEEGVLKSRTVTPGTLIVSNSATPGLPKIMGITGCVHDGWLIIDDFNGVLKEYMYYKFIDIRRVLCNQANGSVFMNLKTDIVKSFTIHIPTIEEQAKMVSFLENIDSKIECNQNICANLEAQAQALFKHWFIDFAPFKDGKFVESELGMIPEGWRVGKLGDVTEFLNGFAFKSSSFVSKGKYKVITIKAVQDGKLITDSADEIEDLSLNIPSHCVLKIGDILLSLTGNVGRVCIVTQDNLVLNQRVCILNPRNLIDRGYVYTLSRTKLLKTRMINIAKGTAQANLSPVETSKLSIVVPPRYILDKFGIIANEYMSEIISAYQENQRLSTLRDTLLPKLMSGEIKV